MTMEAADHGPFSPTNDQANASVSTIGRIGLRGLRSGLKGFKIFIACIALGVAVIASVGALADALSAGFARQGRAILGGDMTFARMHVRATGDELAALERLGAVSETVTLRTMARRLDGGDQALIELKGADNSYPLVGAVEIEPASAGASPSFAEAIAGGGAVADKMLLERLGLKVGDKFRIGEAEIEVKAILKSEPDGVADRLPYGPRVFLSQDELEKTGLIKPGTLVKWRYAIKSPDGAPSGKADFKAQRDSIQKALPESGFTSLDRHDPSPQMTRTLERLRQFLILIGLASLLVGGVGVANAVTTFIDKRIKVIATLRSVGASGFEIMGIFFVQVLVVAALGVAIGLMAGVAVPLIIDHFYGEALPIRAEFSVSALSLTVAAAYGLLIAMIFALWPLGRAEHVKASVLFRDSIQPITGWPRASVLGLIALMIAALLAIAVLGSEPKSLALYIALGLAVMLIVFAALGRLVTMAARRLPRFRRPEVGLAVRNLGAPDGLTNSVVLSLGTGLSLLVAVALAHASLVNELKGRLPERSPDYFLLEVPKTEFGALSAQVQQLAPGSQLTQAPMLRGRLVKLKNQAVEDIKAPPEAQWVLNGDRGLTYTNEVPEGSKVVAGTWWPADYAGPALVSFEADLAKKLGLVIGDTITVNVLGRNVDATIANLREVKWESLAINFVMVFSPNTLQASPHNLLATIRLPKGTAAATEIALVRELGKTFPSVSAIRVRDAIDQFNKIFEKIMTAVRVAGSVTLAAGALVLAGALATAQRRRIVEAVILKTLGATRRQILTAHAIEYALLAAIAAVVATGLGAIAAWLAVSKLMDITFTFSWGTVAAILGLAAALIALFGGFGTWAILRAPPVPYLRSE